MNKILFSDQAKNDLLSIRNYITNELDNPEAAHRIVASITSRLHTLQDYSHLGKPLSTVTNLASDYRFLVCGNYHAFYRCEKNIIYVDRILYYRQDFMRALFGIEKH